MAKRQKFRFKLPKGMTPAERERVGLDVILFIQEQATLNKGYNKTTGRYKRFPKYEKAYAKKKGVGVNDVDLALSESMFNALDIINKRSDSITIGFTNEKENAKAEGNQLGTYGQQDPIHGKARPFLGITNRKLLNIIKDVRNDS